MYDFNKLLTLIFFFLFFTHLLFYFPFKTGPRSAIILGFILLMLPWLNESLLSASPESPVYFPFIKIIHVFYDAIILRVLIVQGNFSRILFGVFSVASVFQLFTICIYAFLLGVFNYPASTETFSLGHWFVIGACLATFPFLYLFGRRPFQTILDSVEKLKWYFLSIIIMFLFALEYSITMAMTAIDNQLITLSSFMVAGTIVAFYFTLYNFLLQKNKSQYWEGQLRLSQKLLRVYAHHDEEMARKDNQIAELKKYCDCMLCRPGTLADTVEPLAGLDGLTCPRPGEGLSELTSYSGNKTANAIVSFYFSLAAKSGARCKAVLDLPDNIGLSDAELSIILGNALENCIKAVRPMGRKGYITLNARQVKDCIVFKFRNSLVPGTYQNGPGLGLEGLRLICSKYLGDVMIVEDSAAFEVTAIIKDNSYCPQWDIAHMISRLTGGKMDSGKMN
ncbi:hypothetical protein C4J81_16080 [Deltaproteobacteria bacterium Smac51]|nr:hypothetical protein C4J81_16080 [Deltaproteobacteria bacterium Smac51]